MGMILIVDDEPELREILDVAMTAEGHQTKQAENGLAALRILEEASQLPDVILLDIMMPQMDGLTFLSHLRESQRLADISVMMVTAYGNECNIARALQLGASGYVTKPFSFDDLCRQVDEILKTKGTHLNVS